MEFGERSSGAAHYAARTSSKAWAAASTVASDFRPEVQALRAFAMMSVVLYHLWPAFLPGGFVGVDVFFVISGFLITRHLVGELHKTGSISLVDFWARRIRRLLPSALTVLLASILILLLLMPEVVARTTLFEIVAAAFYVENWWLAYKAVDYLAAHDSASLVQHYWSLSVEEQFYLGWPILLLTVGRIFKGPSVETAFKWALWFLLVGSLALSWSITADKPPLAFFGTPTRAWEFAAGGLLALVPNLLGRDRSLVRAAASWAGLAVILGSILLISVEYAFPGLIALFPVAGTALVLAGGMSPAQGSSSKLLALPAIQWLGSHSYALYLWHWPLVIAAPWVINGERGWLVNVVILAVLPPLALATQRYVEDPVRTGKFWTVRPWRAYAFATSGMLVIVVMSGAFYMSVEWRNRASAATAMAAGTSEKRCFGAAAMVPQNGCSQPFAQPTDLNLAYAAADTGPVARCQVDASVAEPVFCTYGELQAPTMTVAVVGNSHGLRLVPAFEAYGRTRGWRIILAAKTDCMGLSTKPVGIQQHNDPCLVWSSKVQAHLLGLQQLDAVVFASHAGAQRYLVGVSSDPDSVAAVSENVRATWSAFRARGAAVIVAEDVPGMRPDSGPECIAKAGMADDPCAKDRASVVRSNLLTQIAKDSPQLTAYLGLEEYFCDMMKCHALIGGVVVYSDSHHMTGTFARSLGRYLGPKVEAAARVTASAQVP